MTHHFVKETDAKAAIEKLFGHNGTLAEKTQSALDLTTTPGIGIFVTQVPWIVTLPQGIVTGSSESMRNAARDIHAQLHTLAKSLPPETPVTVDIDEKRLQAPQVQGGGLVR